VTSISNRNFAGSAVARALTITHEAQVSAVRRVGSGLRISGASDDAAGLAIGERLANQRQGLDQGARNAQDAQSLLRTAEGGLAETHRLLGRLRELAVHSANDTLTASDRATIQVEASQLVAEIDRVAQATAFNGTTLLDKNRAVSLHNGGVGLRFQVGANQSAAANTMVATISAARARDLGDVRTLSAAYPALAGGANTLTIGATAIGYDASVDTVFDLRDLINAKSATHGVTASVTSGGLILDSGSASVGLVDTGGVLGALFGGATATTAEIASGSTTLARLGVTTGTVDLTLQVAARPAELTDTLASLGVNGGSLDLAISEGLNATPTFSVTFGSADTVGAVLARIDAAVSTAATGGFAGIVGDSVSLSTTTSSGHAGLFAIAVAGGTGGASNGLLDTLSEGAGGGNLLASLNIAQISNMAPSTDSTSATAVQMLGETRHATVAVAPTDTLVTVAANVTSAIAAAGFTVRDVSGALVYPSGGGATGMAGGAFTIDTGTSSVVVSAVTATATNLLATLGLAVVGTPGRSITTASPPVTVGGGSYQASSIALVGATSLDSGIGGTLRLDTQAEAGRAISLLDLAIDQVSASRASLGALDARLDSATRSHAFASENIAAARSRIVDADLATEMSNLVRLQILERAGIALMAQANQSSAAVLRLLG
jgi:flagellin